MPAKKRPTSRRAPAPAPRQRRARRRTQTAYERLSGKYRLDLARHGIFGEDWEAGFGRRRTGRYDPPPLEDERTRRRLVDRWAETGDLGEEGTTQALRWAAASGGAWDETGTAFLAFAMAVPEPPTEWEKVSAIPETDGIWVFTVKTPTGYYAVPVPSQTAPVILHGLSVVKSTVTDFDYDVSGTPS